MTRIGLVFIAVVIMSASITIWVAYKAGSDNKQYRKLEMEWYNTVIEGKDIEINIIRLKLAIEKAKNTEKDSILVVYKESMKAHSMGLQDANWRLIQLKRFIESQ